MKNIFQRNSRVKNPRSGFNMSFGKKLSLDMGEIVPIFLKEVIPSDEWDVRTEIFARFAPLIAPMLHRVDIFTWYFYVPYRILWDSWEDFINGGSEASGIQNPIMPMYNLGGADKDSVAKGTLADYLGVPVHDPGGAGFGPHQLDLCKFPFQAYVEIWNEYFRDQHLQDSVDISTLTWAEAQKLRMKSWEKDYFTSAAPNTQRGPEIFAPLDVSYLDQSVVKEDDGTNPVNNANLQTGTGAASDDLIAGTRSARVENIDPTDTGTKITELRKAFKLQEYWEQAMRIGTRYKEWLFGSFGVWSSDARLDRPEYLGGGRQAVQISEVLNTAGDNAGSASAVGDMAGHGISVGKRHGFRKSFEEFGLIMGLMCVMPKTAYYQGLERHWTKQDRFDFFTPQLAHIGEQAIKNKEVYYDLGDVLARDNYEDTFGYQQRYAEYKQSFSNVHGDFKDNLDFWHMGRKFPSGANPALNEDFVVSDPTKRVFAVDDGTDSLWCEIWHDAKAIRPVPYFSDPKLAG